MARQVDGKGAALAGPVLHAQRAAVCLHAALDDGQAQTQASLVRSALGERHKQLVRIPPGQAPARAACANHMGLQQSFMCGN